MWSGSRRLLATWGALFGLSVLVACEAADREGDEPEAELAESTLALGAPYALGTGSAAGNTWTRFSASGSTLYAVPITPARAARLSSLRLFAAAAGGSCRMGLYDEANARPSRLLASTSSTTLVAGTNALVPTALPDLSAGRRYWVGALCSGASRLVRQPLAGETSYAGFAFSFFPLPTTFPSGATSTTGTALGLYAMVDDLAAQLCTPGSSQCLSASTRGVCAADGSAWIASQCSNQACIGGVCAGACTPGSARCSGASTVEVCAANGSWATSSVCAAGQLCSNGACVVNTPFNLGAGAGADASWLGWSVPTDVLHLVPVTPPTNVSVQALRLVGSGAGGTCRMALYADSAGTPGSLLGAGTNFAVAAGANGTPPSTSLVLSGGRTYWVGAVCSGAAQLYQRSAAGGSVVATSLAAGSPFPQTFPSNTTRTTGSERSFFLTVQAAP